MLKARAQAAQAQKELQSAVGSFGNDSAMSAFEKMEEKVEALEASGQAAAELVGSNLESQFAALESGNNVDDELLTLKNQLDSDPETLRLPQKDSGSKIKVVNVEEIDSELENLKKSIDNL